MSNGWKNNPGNSARHFALSLNNAVIKFIRRRNIPTSSSKITVRIVAIIENVRNARSFLTDSSNNSEESVASNVFFIPAYVHHNRPVPAIKIGSFN